jgi:hypothetical protein
MLLVLLCRGGGARSLDALIRYLPGRPDNKANLNVNIGADF